jgi:hypothetical protein
MSSNLVDTELLAPDEAFELLEADIFEQPQKVSDNFDAMYQNIKQTLFKNTAADKTDKTDKTKREALDKIFAISQSKLLDEEYMKNLKSATEMGALSGLSMQYIRQLKPKDFSTLLQQIEPDFLDRVTKMAREVDDGMESIILSEELR